MTRNLIAINKLSGNEDPTPKYNSKNKNDKIKFIKTQTGADYKIAPQNKEINQRINLTPEEIRKNARKGLQ